MRQDRGMAAYMSARQAAAYCGVSEKTVRRWIASGKLAAQRDGASFRIAADSLYALQARGNGHAADTPRPHVDMAADSRAAGAAAPDMSASTAAAEAAHLAALVRDLQQQNVELAGRVGFYQARIQELEGRLLLTAGPPAEAPAKAPDARRGRPFWAFWRREANLP